MNKYSRVFHHITIEDVKRTKRDSSLVERLEEFKVKMKEHPLFKYAMELFKGEVI